MPQPLPIDEHLPRAVQEFRCHGALVLTAPPGSGKTTRLPAALVDAGLGGEVVVLEPRRLAARSAARRVAQERGGRLGDEVGYQVRHDRRTSSRTRIRYVTEGVLVRRLIRDPFLERVGAVVLDEFHERHLEGDLALAMLREVRETVRPDLRLVVMSATLDVEPIRAFLAGCPGIDAPGTLHRVHTVHAQRPDRGPLARRVAAAVKRALAETAGDVLVFLPGVGEIEAAQRALSASPLPAEVLPLHGRLTAQQQDRAVAPQPFRRVVLATNVAESSITVAGVTAVVDSGLARVLRHEPRTGIDTLRVEPIARASADQRRGRAGREREGVCYRLWTVGEERGMPAQDVPEVRRVDLAGAVLQVRAFAGRPAAEFGWFEPPARDALARAESLLVMLGALGPGGGGVTELGRRMLQRPVHPRLGRLLLEGEARGCGRAAAGAAALLAEREVWSEPADRPGDLVASWQRVAEVLEEGASEGSCRRVGLRPGAARAVARAWRQLAPAAADRAGGEEDLAKAILAGFPDRVARRVPGGAALAVLVGGRGLRLPEESLAEIDELLVALQVIDLGARDARAVVETWLPIERSWLEELFPDSVRTEAEAELEEAAGRVVGVRRTRFHDLVLEEARGGEPPSEETARLLSALVAQDPWGRIEEPEPLRRLIERVAWVRELGERLPELGDADVAAAAEEAVAGRSSLTGLRGREVAALLQARLGPAACALLDRHAPERVPVPSGRRVPVDYGAGAGPSIAVPIQELFGSRETPRAGPRPLVVHLLAPNRRPVQVTRDLESFWSSVYPKVRSELRRRYPRHAWPEDPLAAAPESRPRRRQRP